MEPGSAEPTKIAVSDNQNKKGETIDVAVAEQDDKEATTPVKAGQNTAEFQQESPTTVIAIIGEDEDGEAIDMSDIRVLEDLDTENKSPEKEEIVPDQTENLEDDEDGDNKDSRVKKKKSYEFFYPDMVSTLELALRGLPGMANCQKSKVIVPQKDSPSKGPSQTGSPPKRPTLIRDFAKEAKKALKKSGNIVDVRATRKSTRNSGNLPKPVYCSGNVATAQTVGPKKVDQPKVVLGKKQGKESKEAKLETPSEPVAKKTRNTPKTTGKKSKVMPQAVAKQPKVTPQAVAKQPKVTPQAVAKQQKVTPQAVAKQPKVTPQAVAKQPKVTPQAVTTQPKVTPQAVTTQPKVTPQAVTTQPKGMPQAAVKRPTFTFALEPKPANQTKPNVTFGPMKPCGPETYVVAPGGSHMEIKYPLPSNSVFRQSAPRMREWRKKGTVRTTKSKASSRLIIDNQKEIPTMIMKMRVSDTSDIITTLDLAPPTKKLMKFKETEASKVFTVPGRNLTPRLAWPLFYPNLLTKPRGDDSDDDDDVMGDDVPAEDENLDGQKKFTIIRSEPLNMSDGEDNIHYTNVLSDEDDDIAEPIYAEPQTSLTDEENKVDDSSVGKVSEDTSVDTPPVIKPEGTTDKNQPNSDSVQNPSPDQVQPVKPETVTSQTVPTSEETPLVVQGDITTVTVPPQPVTNSSVSNTAAENIRMDTSVVDISLTSVNSGQTMTDSAIVNQASSISSNAESTEEGCVIVSVVTEISEPYVEQEGEIMLQTDSANNSSGDQYILYVEK
ncbi:cytadherence high molecular weight protein 1-like isoform X2 [Pecten maximus]|uniref:cytadherence high molecular weight protein 1-like isoform X2 n=1 Tax=Pecten maximus TaxID=6579 RepID=UPI001458A59E|nr:cytadherence high molecular weight protein 1-like isoform X2 [Pecten maximus]